MYYNFNIQTEFQLNVFREEDLLDMAPGLKESSRLGWHDIIYINLF